MAATTIQISLTDDERTAITRAIVIARRALVDAYLEDESLTEHNQADIDRLDAVMDKMDAASIAAHGDIFSDLT